MTEVLIIVDCLRKVFQNNSKEIDDNNKNFFISLKLIEKGIKINKANKSLITFIKKSLIQK